MSIYRIPKQKNGKKKKDRKSRLGLLDFQSFVERTSVEFKNGKSSAEIFEIYGIVNSQKKEYEYRLLQYFLNSDVDLTDYRLLSRIAGLHGGKMMDLGFVYLIKIDNRIKFGKTKDLASRLLAYKSNSGVVPKLINFIFGVNYSNKEKVLINEFRNKGITKEWFNDDMEDLIMKRMNTI